MEHHRRRCSAAALICLALLAGAATAQVYVTEGTNISVDVSADGRMAMDLLGDLWIVPADGGEAQLLQSGARVARRPRFSPSGDAIAYEATVESRGELRVLELDTGNDRSLSTARWSDRQPHWHPDGERIVFSSARNGTGFDLWEIDVPTGLAWRLSHMAGNETEPAWSADGRNLVYVHEFDGVWSIMMRRRGSPDEILVSSDSRLSAPSWRPDGSLVTYLRRDDTGWSVAMTILSEPRLDRSIIDGEDFFLAPIAWQNRQSMYYAANGQLRRRNFNAWSSSNIPFRANVGRGANAASADIPRRELDVSNAATVRTIIRIGRLFDGVDGRYRYNADIVIENGRITAVTDQKDHENGIVVDLADLTAIPGLVDAHAILPARVDVEHGPLLLTLGLTTVAADVEDAERLNASWSGKETPGPRVVAESWRSALDAGAAAFPGNRRMPMSPAGYRYQDVLFASGSATTTWLSGLADASTPFVETIWSLRQSRLIGERIELARRFTATPDLSAVATTIVLASKPNGLPAGLGLHAELRALVGAGLSPEQALKAGGVNASAALGYGPHLGRIAPGSGADMVLVDGDPLADITDALKIVGIVRNGRFFSVSGLIDRAGIDQIVE